jgi:hypothetical protein
MSPGPGWINVTLTPPYFLPAGHYYLDMPALNGSTNPWQHSANGLLSDTWMFNTTSGNWEQQNWNLTLITYTSNAVSPEAAGMTISSQAVQDINSSIGLGFANISSPISGSLVSLPVMNNTPIAYSFAFNATFSRFTLANVSVLVNETYPNWTIGIPIFNPGVPYFNYQANITGFPSDAYNIIAYSGSMVVGYDQINPATIELYSQADHVTFQSPNYLSLVQIPSHVYTGDSPNISVMALAMGNVSIFIYENSMLIYQNSTISAGLASFYWAIPASATAGVLSILTYYTGNNEVGSNETTETLETDARLNSVPLIVPALGMATLNCSYCESYSNIAITGAQVSFSVGDLTGDLSFQNTGNYTSDIDFSEYELIPGNYNISVQAEEDGFRPQNITVPLEIIPRSVSIVLTQSGTVLHPGEAVQFNLSVTDTLTGQSLPLPVNVSLQIVRSGAAPTDSNTLIASYLFTGITATGQYTWFVPSSFFTGDYDVILTIQNPFFSGSEVLTSAINIFPLTLPWLLIIIFGIGAIFGTAIYVQHEKRASKRSIQGLMIMDHKGTNVAQRITPEFSEKHSLLVSGAISGVMTLMQEITGKGLRRIKVEGGYIELIQRRSIWFVFLLRNNPTWIMRTTRKCATDIDSHYHSAIMEWTGGDLEISIDDFVKKWFGVMLSGNRKSNTPPELETRIE